MSDRFLGFIENLEVGLQDRSFDLDNFATDWEQQFPDTIKINPNLKIDDFSQRPRIKEHNEEGDAILNEGYRLVEYFPNRDNQEESFLCFGTPSEIRTQIVLIHNTWLMMQSSVNGWLGFPYPDWMRASPQSHASLQIIMLPNKFGRNYPSELYWSRRQVSIPRPDRSKLTYRALRDAAGGTTGLDWGEWRATAFLESPEGSNFHKMIASGPTETTAQANLNRFLPFTKCKVLDYTTGKLDFSKGNRAKDPNRDQRQNLKIFPAWVWVYNRSLFPPDYVTGKPTKSGKQSPKKFKFRIDKLREPAGWGAGLTDAFRHHLGGFVE